MKRGGEGLASQLRKKLRPGPLPLVPRDATGPDDIVLDERATASSRWSTAAVLGDSGSSYCDDDVRPGESADITAWLGRLPPYGGFADPSSACHTPPSSNPALPCESTAGPGQSSEPAPPSSASASACPPAPAAPDAEPARLSHTGEADSAPRAPRNVPEAVRRYIDLARADSATPDLGPDVLARHVGSLEALAHAGCSEAEVRQFYLRAVFAGEQQDHPGAGDPLAWAVAVGSLGGPGALAGAEGISGVNAPTLYGYSSDEDGAFSKEQLREISAPPRGQAQLPQACPHVYPGKSGKSGKRGKSERSAVQFPFLVLSFSKSDGARNSYARATMDCIMAGKELQHRLPAAVLANSHLRGSAGLFGPTDNVCFGVVADEQHAETFLTWHNESTGELLSEQVAQYVVTAPHELRRLCCHARNILEFGRRDRLAKIRATLAAFAEWDAAGVGDDFPEQ